MIEHLLHEVVQAAATGITQAQAEPLGIELIGGGFVAIEVNFRQIHAAPPVLTGSHFDEHVGAVDRVDVAHRIALIGRVIAQIRQVVAQHDQRFLGIPGITIPTLRGAPVPEYPWLRRLGHRAEHAVE
uniref:hypothetical protein n=1 Tax=Xanthomonas albilineans TaxID=29447 RepID=UPI0027DD088E|nr:hypothetical protein [Xanthomonas albilineans]